MKIVERLSGLLEFCCRQLMIFLMIVISFTLLIQIIARFILEISAPWTDELARFAMVWLIFIGSAVAYRRGAHININILEERFPQVKRILGLIQGILMLIYLLVVATVGWNTLALVAKQRSANIGMSMTILYLALPVTAGLMGVFFIEKLRKYK